MYYVFIYMVQNGYEWLKEATKFRGAVTEGTSSKLIQMQEGSLRGG
jgi:hypothetical protein